MAQSDPSVVLGIVADLGSIFTGLSSLAIAVFLIGRRWHEQRTLEKYLKRMTRSRQSKEGQGLENILEVMRQTKLGEQAIMRAAFGSKNVRVRSRLGADGRTTELVFGYGDHDKG